MKTETLISWLMPVFFLLGFLHWFFFIPCALCGIVWIGMGLETDRDHLNKVDFDRKNHGWLYVEGVKKPKLLYSGNKYRFVINKGNNEFEEELIYIGQLTEENAFVLYEPDKTEKESFSLPKKVIKDVFLIEDENYPQKVTVGRLSEHFVKPSQTGQRGDGTGMLNAMVGWNWMNFGLKGCNLSPQGRSSRVRRKLRS